MRDAEIARALPQVVGKIYDAATESNKARPWRQAELVALLLRAGIPTQAGRTSP